MNKRKFKKKHPDCLPRMMLKHCVEWCDLYRRELRKLREQKNGHHADHIFFPEISRYYANWWKAKLRDESKRM